MPISATVVVAGPVAAVSTEQWRKRMQVNKIGQLSGTRAVLPRPRGSHGRVVVTSSADGRRFSPRRCVRMPAARGRRRAAVLTPGQRERHTRHRC